VSLPVQMPDGKWQVGDQIFETNAKAWRWIDRQENEPISRAEDVSDWVTRKILFAERPEPKEWR
jgi:hypothetical protein